ncbi:MAG TPA: putative toxin-antitoxin system toxin component, PIN family [Opitutaceae bacterium]
MRRPVVVDTNVVVAGLISSPGDSPVCRVLDGMLSGSFPFLLSAELLDEYRRVLLRPALKKLHGLSIRQVDIVLTEIAANAVIREPEAGRAHEAPDPGDDHLWRLLAIVSGAVLVTGDRLLLQRPPDFASVVSPGDFVDWLKIGDW